MNEQRVTRFTVTPSHWPSVFTSYASPSGVSRYGIRVPACDFPEVDRRDEGPLIQASSVRRPAVIPDLGSDLDFADWEDLTKQADRWGYPLDNLLHGREVIALCEVYTINAGEWAGKWRQARKLAALTAIRVLGSPVRDEGLQAHIDKIMELLK